MPVLQCMSAFLKWPVQAEPCSSKVGLARTRPFQHPRPALPSIGESRPDTLAVNMGTSVDMIEKHYGHVKPLQAHKEPTAR